MKKVLTGVLALLLIFSLAGCGGKESESEAAVVEEIAAEKVAGEQIAADAEVFIKNIEYPGDIETGLIDPVKIAALFDESTEKYLWYEVNTEVLDEECGLYALGRDAFKARIEDRAIEDEINTYSDTEVRREELDRIEENAISIFDGYLTHGDGKNYKGYFESPFTAFDETIVAGSEFTPDEFFKENGLDLYFRNAEVEQIVSSNILVLSQWIVTAKVKVTVDCYENSGIFSGVEWIPTPGTEKEMEFAVTYMSYYTKDSDLHELQVYDICVL